MRQRCRWYTFIPRTVRGDWTCTCSSETNSLKDRFWDDFDDCHDPAPEPWQPSSNVTTTARHLYGMKPKKTSYVAWLSLVAFEHLIQIKASQQAKALVQRHFKIISGRCLVAFAPRLDDAVFVIGRYAFGTLIGVCDAVTVFE
jgi:hypothetical protein